MEIPRGQTLSSLPLRQMIASYNMKAENPVPFTIGIYGDMGVLESNNTRARLFERVASNDMDFIWHLGDIR